MATTKRSSLNAPLSKLRNDATVDGSKPKNLSSTTAALKSLLGFTDRSSSSDKLKLSTDQLRKSSVDSLCKGSKSPNPSDLRRKTLQRPSPATDSPTSASSATSSSFERFDDRLNSTDSLAGYRSADKFPSSYRENEVELCDDWIPNSIQDFSIYKMLGKGAFSKVYLCRRKEDGKIFALKSMRKDLIVKLKQTQHVHDEKQLLSAAVSPFITQFHYSLQDQVHLFIIMEYVGGGDLFTCIKNNGRFDNPSAKFYASEIFLALQFLHGKKIAYRDLKPENILIGLDGHAKLADFGFAKRITHSTTTFCGTPSYIAPEVIRRLPYGLEVDWWSFGILIFELLSGCSPFQDENSRKTYDRIVTERIRWPPNPSKYFNDDAYDIINCLLVSKPEDRLGYEDDNDISDHAWFSGTDWEAMTNVLIRPPTNMIQSVHRRSESVKNREYSYKGSGDMLNRLGNSDLGQKFNSGIYISPDEAETILSSENLCQEPDTSSSASYSDIFADF